MYSRKSVIRAATAALVIGAGLATFGGTALADPGYRSQNVWQNQTRQHQRWQQQSFYQHSRYHYRHYDHNQYNRGRFGRVRYQQRWDHRARDHQGWHHHDWSGRYDGHVAYRASAVRAYIGPSALSFTINLPPSAGLNGH